MNPVLIAAILVPALPAAASVTLMALGRKLGERSGYVAIGALVGSLLSAVYLLFRVLAQATAAVAAEGGEAAAEGGHAPVALLHATFRWMTVGDIGIDFGLHVDGLSASVLVMVAAVALMVFIYATGYMHEDPRYGWFFAVFSLFTMSMFALVESSNLLMLMVFWEVMGLCSFLLIGFWYERPEARRASMKAFLTTRVGDMGFLAAMALLLAKFHTLDIPQLMKAVEETPKGSLFVIAALLFCGAVGKSAQFPLHIWLPDAMAGPTPVSGLLHSATMVAAGVYLVARSFPLFEVSGFLPFVAGAGIFSAIYAAALALTETDIKRTLAYSTMSQLGYMMAALGAGGFVAAVFHLITHGFFKSLLFLSAGSVIHGTGTQDIRELGGLGKKMKWTAASFMVGSLALAGIPPLAGFFSKDAILLSLWQSPVFPNGGGNILFLMGLANAVLSAFYMFRVYFRVFGGAEPEHAHESPKVMLAPMLVLAGLTSVAGLINLPGVKPSLAELVEPGVAENALLWLMVLSACAAGAGVYMAWEQNRARLSREAGETHADEPFGLERVYGWVFLRQVFQLSEGMRKLDVDRLVNSIVLTPVMKVSDGLRKADIDVVYSAIFVRFTGIWTEGLRRVDVGVIDRGVMGIGHAGMWVARASGLVDTGGVDRGVNAVSDGTLGLAAVLKRLQTGVVANYALFMLLFGVSIFYVARWLTP